jgi:hypothetical protein
MRPRLLSGVLLCAIVAACDNPLEVANLVQPDIGRVFATPASIETVIGGGYQGCHNAHVVNADLNAQLLVLGLESYSQLNNFNMGARGAIPRSPILNVRGSDAAHKGAYSRLTRGARLAVNAVRALDSMIAAGGTLGSEARDLRARSFAFFTIACNQGHIALMYDSAAVLSAGKDAAGNHDPAFHFDSIPPLAGYAQVMANAIRMLDSAEAIANLNPAGFQGFPLPDAWLSGSSHSSRNAFVRLIRSFRARFRAGVARSPAERALVRWDSVLMDASSGINTNFLVNAGGTTGWNVGFVGSQMHFSPTWSQMPLMYFGMADRAGGCYAAYIARPRAERDPNCLIITPDTRWPQGASRVQQQVNSSFFVRPSSLSSRPYISNRLTQDPLGDPWGFSQYDFYRMVYIFDNFDEGQFPDMTRAEIDLLSAEAYLHGADASAATTPANTSALNLSLAAGRIDFTRVPASLPSVSGVVTPTQPVPGGGACVPRVPQPPTFTLTACGTLYEAMKYEKRMETAYTGFGQWFVDSRGWGDLVENTPLHFPVPYPELDALLKPYYSLGGGGTASAPKGTYGF